MNINESREMIEELEEYIQLIENYEVQTFEQEAIYLYVQTESVSKVADLMNKKGYKVGNRKLISKDISDVIRSKLVDEMHEMSKKIFKRNKKRTSGPGWM